MTIGYINRLSEIRCPSCGAPFDILTIDVRVRHAEDNEYNQSYDMTIKCEACKTVFLHAKNQS